MIALILAAAGSGARFGGSIPKQFLAWEGTPLLVRALRAFEPHCDEAVVLVPAGWEAKAESLIRGCPFAGQVSIHPGGEHRQDSVKRGLAQLRPGVDLVMVHDAARPFVSARLIESVIQGARLHSACIPGLPVADTVKEVEAGFIHKTLDRRRLVLVQTPQGFRRDLLELAFDRAIEEGYHGTDEAVLVERLGVPVFVVPGEPENRKITWKTDLSNLP